MDKNRKIKLLFRHRSMEMGGVEKVLLSILHNLDSKKFEMTVLLSLNQGELRNEFPKHVRKVYLAGGKEDFSKNSLIQKFQLLKRRLLLNHLNKNPQIIDQKYLNEEYDVEIAMANIDFDFVLRSTNKKSKKIGWFHAEIDIPKMQPIVPQILNNFPKFDVMIYCSQRIKDKMHKCYPDLAYPEEKVIVNAIPIEEIKRKSLEKTVHLPEKPLFVSIGRLHSRKGYHKLVEAHAKLIREGFFHSILVIGDGEEMDNLRNQIKSNGVEKTFILAGNIMNPYPYIKNADFFILPSESEAWPLVIAEALILQKPIIATNVGDVGIMIQDRKTGYLIHYEIDEMYKAMKEFLTNKTLISAIQNNLLNIEKQFDNEKIFNKIEETILNLKKNNDDFSLQSYFKN
jgi:glycosyltransferase involved in cell wall biosynthesis